MVSTVKKGKESPSVSQGFMGKEPRPSYIGRRLAIDGAKEWGEGKDAREVSAKVVQWVSGNKKEKPYYWLNCDDDTSVKAGREFVERYLVEGDEDDSDNDSEEEEEDGAGSGASNLEEQKSDDDDDDDDDDHGDADDLNLLAAAAHAQKEAQEADLPAGTPESSAQSSSRPRRKGKGAGIEGLYQQGS